MKRIWKSSLCKIYRRWEIGTGFGSLSTRVVNNNTLLHCHDYFAQKTSKKKVSRNMKFTQKGFQHIWSFSDHFFCRKHASSFSSSLSFANSALTYCLTKILKPKKYSKGSKCRQFKGAEQNTRTTRKRLGLGADY